MTFALVFENHGEEIGPGHIRARGTAPSASIVSRIGAEGVETEHRPLEGEQAVFRSEVRLLGTTALDEWGTIELGEGNVLHFQTIGEGYTTQTAIPGVGHGTIMWEITHGEGAFEGATGLIASNFITHDDGVTDHQFGVVWLP